MSSSDLILAQFIRLSGPSSFSLSSHVISPCPVSAIHCSTTHRAMGTQAPTQQDSYDRAERQVPPLPPPPTIDIEAQEAAAHEPVLPPLPPAPLPIDTAATEAKAAAARPVPVGLEIDSGKVDSWGIIMVNFCLSTAVAVALSSPQLQPSPTPSFHIFSFIISLSFASLFVSHFIQSRFPVIAQVLYRVGIFFAFTAFFIAITIHFPPCLKLITWFIYALCFALCLFVIFVPK